MAKRFFGLLCYFCFTVVVAPNFLLADDSKASESALNHLQKLAAAELQLAQARYDRQAFRLDSLRELKQQGYASFKEVTFAELQHATNRSYLQAMQRFAGFVDELASASEQAITSPGDIAFPPTVVLSIPGLASDPRTRLFSAVQVPATAEVAKAISLQSQIDQSCRSARVNAWSALRTRLQSSALPSPELEKEIAVTGLEQRIAQAENNLAAMKQNIVKQFTHFTPFDFDGLTIADTKELLKLVNLEFDRLQHFAVLQASEENGQLMSELEDRVARAAGAGASPPRELTFVRHSIANSQLQASVAAQWLRSMHQATEEQSVKRFTFVSRDNRRERSNTSIDLSSARLEILRHAMLERVLDASDEVDNAVSRLDYLDEKLVRLTMLVQRDDFFLGEARRLQLELAIAQAEVDYAESQHAQRALEMEFVERLHGAKHGDWIAPLTELFKHRANSTAAETLATRTLELDRWRLSGCRTLHGQGVASWKELTAARVRRDETIDKREKARADRAVAGMIVKILRDAGDDVTALVLSLTR